jgi:hypothetical protein
MHNARPVAQALLSAGWKRSKGCPGHSEKNGLSKTSASEADALGAYHICNFVGAVGFGRRLEGIEMPEKPDLFKEELDQLGDQEIEARLAAAVWVDDKRAAVLRYLEEKKLGKKNEARSAELEIARSAKEAAWAAASMAKEANWRANLAITIASVAAAAAISAAVVALVALYIKR